MESVWKGEAIIFSMIKNQVNVFVICKYELYVVLKSFKFPDLLLVHSFSILICSLDKYRERSLCSIYRLAYTVYLPEGKKFSWEENFANIG